MKWESKMLKLRFRYRSEGHHRLAFLTPAPELALTTLPASSTISLPAAKIAGTCREQKQRWNHGHRACVIDATPLTPAEYLVVRKKPFIAA
jgi:hypothetical protein